MSGLPPKGSHEKPLGCLDGNSTSLTATMVTDDLVVPAILERKSHPESAKKNTVSRKRTVFLILVV